MQVKFLWLLFLPDHCQAELLLQHAGIEDTHVVVHDREGQHVAVGALTEAGQRADAIRMGERTRLATHQPFEFRVAELGAQRTVYTGDRQPRMQLLADRRTLIAIAEYGDEYLRRQMVVGAEATAVVDDDALILQSQAVAHETTEIVHADDRQVAALVEMVADGIEQGCRLRVAAVLPHLLDHIVHRTAEAEQRAGVACQSAVDHLTVSKLIASLPEGRHHGFAHLLIPFIQDAVA